MSSTIVRVKRRLEENPLEAVVLHCKKFCKDKDTELLPSVFVFSGTVDEKYNSSPHIKKEWLQNHDAERTLKTTKNVSDIINKQREEHNDSVKTNRMKVINCSRGLSLCPDDIAAGGELLNTDYTLLDLHHSTIDEEPMSGFEEKFAYDVYLSQHSDFDVKMLDDIVRIDPYSADSLYMPYRDDGNKSSDDEEQDEDSNDENNYRNDYPDTDADSINQDDMECAMRRMGIDELSTDEDMDDEYVPRYRNVKYDGKPSLITCDGVEYDRASSVESSRSISTDSNSYTGVHDSESD